ncbi:MAG: hypothetical protein WC869_08370 [Phycisphaerae bacterium]
MKIAAFVIGDEDAFGPALDLGIDPVWLQDHFLAASSIKEAIEAIETIDAWIASGDVEMDADNPFFVLVDDVTRMAAETLKRIPAVYGQSGNEDIRARYGTSSVWAGKLDVALDNALFSTFCTMHRKDSNTAKDEKTGKETFTRGGPKLASHNQTEPFIYARTHVLGCGQDPKSKHPLWKGCYTARNNHPLWGEKCRTWFHPLRAPMNVGEHLRFSGCPVARPPGLDWMEGWVDAAAGWFKDGYSWTEVLAALRDAKVSKHPGHVLWTMNDAWARWQIRELHEKYQEGIV